MNESLKVDIKNWRTTIVGFIAGLIICLTQVVNLLDSDPETIFETAIFLSGLAAMGIGAFARDGHRSSKSLDLPE